MAGFSGPVSESKYIVNAGWDDVPHLDEATKRQLYESTPRHLRDARSKGIPGGGEGLIYPYEMETILCEPFRIPAYYRRCYGLDVGWNKTAAIWIAQDPDTEVMYAYAEYSRGRAEPSTHAAAIRVRGDWMLGAIDPASRGRSQKDGEQLIQAYRDNGLQIVPAVNAVNAGIHRVDEAFSMGTLKIFPHLRATLNELRLYRRDENGNVVKKFDHLMDAKRYCINTFNACARTKPHKIVGGSVQSHHAVDKRAGY